MIIKGLFTSTIYRGDLDLRVTLIPGFFNFSILKILRVFRISLFQFFSFSVFQFFSFSNLEFSSFQFSRFLALSGILSHYIGFWGPKSVSLIINNFGPTIS